jgi:hypothetical protein
VQIMILIILSIRTHIDSVFCADSFELGVYLAMAKSFLNQSTIGRDLELVQVSATLPEPFDCNQDRTMVWSCKSVNQLNLRQNLSR